MKSTIDFSAEQWERIRDVYGKWWDGTLGRPLIHIPVSGRDPDRAPAQHPFKGSTAHYDLSVPAEEVVDSWDYHLAGFEYVGDSFPTVFNNFGPGVMAAFLGAIPDTANDTVWYHPPEHKPVADWSFTYDAGNVWLQRVRDISRAAMERWQGQVQVSMTDLGGNLDILASFRPSEELLLDLYDFPDAVKRLTWEVHELWKRYFDELNGVLQPANPGYTAWTPIYSATPYYMLQCDFCYMIGPDMFEEFVKPELVAACAKIDHAFYHLDGPGQLPHLDSLLEIEELDGVQWIPGDGAPPITEWPEVYRRISEAGKKIQIWGGIEQLDIIADQIGRADNIICISNCTLEDRDDLAHGLYKHDVKGTMLRDVRVRTRELDARPVFHFERCQDIDGQ